MPVHLQICRLCMRKYCAPALMENIFLSETVTVEAIKMVTQIEVKEGDGLPPFACLLCIITLTNAMNFIQACIDCNKKLKFLLMMKDSVAGQDNAENENCPKIEPKEENEVVDETGAADISAAVLDTKNKEIEKNVNAEQVVNTEYLTATRSHGSGRLNSLGSLGLGQAECGNSSKQDDRKRRRSASPCERNPVKKVEDEPELDEAAEVLSWYDSDLNLVIDKAGFLSAAPMHINGFGYIWAGARATFGFATGKLAFQTKVEEDLDVSHLEKESCPNVLRVGWSVPSASMQLGEEPLSYGFGGTGKAFTDCKFKTYGVPFTVGDIVTSYLEWSEDNVVLSFAVNGETHGEAYRVPREKLGGQPLFPHVLSKNQRFSVDFGAREEPWFPLDEGFVFVGAAPVEGRVPGPCRPEKKKNCEMVMMCGLPGAGKTTWVNKYVATRPDKKFNVLGTNALIDKMRVDGLPRKGNYEGRWEELIEKCTRCLLKLMEVAAGRRRNYILDQTNVHPSARRRKMRGFEGFVRRAIVIVPTEEEFKSRVAKRETLEGKDVQAAALLEMKANFVLPEEGDVFSEVTFVDRDRKKSRLLVELYNKEGCAAGYGEQSKRPRVESSDCGEQPPGPLGHGTNGGPHSSDQCPGVGSLQPSAGSSCRDGSGDRGGWRGHNRGANRGNRQRGSRGYGQTRQQPRDFASIWGQGYNQGSVGNGRGRGQGYNQQQQEGRIWGQQVWMNQQGGGYGQQGGYNHQSRYGQQTDYRNRNYGIGNVAQQQQAYFLSGHGQQTSFGNGNVTQQQQAYYQQAYNWG